MILMFNVSSISNQSFAVACSSNITRLLLLMLKIQMLARFKHSSLSLELGWQNYAKKKTRYMSNPSIYCWRLILILMFNVLC